MPGLLRGGLDRVFISPAGSYGSWAAGERTGVAEFLFEMNQPAPGAPLTCARSRVGAPTR